MKEKKNCWEYYHCGRQPGGSRSKEAGVCPATRDESADGINGGKKGGRICWAVSSTLCGGANQGSLAQKYATCLSCTFFKMVYREEGDAFAVLKPGQRYTKCCRGAGRESGCGRYKSKVGRLTGSDKEKTRKVHLDH